MNKWAASEPMQDDSGVYNLALKGQALGLEVPDLVDLIVDATSNWSPQPDVSSIIDAVQFASKPIEATKEPSGEDFSKHRYSDYGLWESINPGPNAAKPVSLGLPSLDALVSPDTGQFIVVGAKPKVGKSSLVMQAADATCELCGHQEGCVLVVSLEMTATELGQVRLAQRMGVARRPNRRMPGQPNLFELSGRDRERAKEYVETWRSTRDMRIIDMEQTGGDAELPRLAAMVREHAKKYPAFRMLVWDHTALADLAGDSSDHAVVAATTKLLKRLQSELGVFVLAPTQPNKPDAKDPYLTHAMLCGGASIHRNPSHVIIINDMSNDEDSTAPDVEIRLVLSRDGPTGSVNAVFHKGAGQVFKEKEVLTKRETTQHARMHLEPTDDEDLFASVPG